MKNLDFEWLTDEFMLYCRSIQGHCPAYKNGRLNLSELARVCRLSGTTVYKYLSLVEE